MNQYERNFIQDSISNGALLVAALVWVVLAAVQGAPLAQGDAMLARVPAASLHAVTPVPAVPAAMRSIERSAASVAKAGTAAVS